MLVLKNEAKILLEWVGSRVIGKSLTGRCGYPSFHDTSKVNVLLLAIQASDCDMTFCV